MFAFGLRTIRAVTRPGWLQGAPLPDPPSTAAADDAQHVGRRARERGGRLMESRPTRSWFAIVVLLLLAVLAAWPLVTPKTIFALLLIFLCGFGVGYETSRLWERRRRRAAAEARG